MQLKKPMRRRTKAIIAIGVLIAVAAICRMYYVDEDSGPWLLWNDKAAYLFNTTVRRGYYETYLGYPWALLMAYLGAPGPPTEERWSMQVIRVTAGSVEHYNLDLPDGMGTSPDRYTVRGGIIYANCQSSICRWEGDHFEEASQEEKQRLGNPLHLPKDANMEYENGWSKRSPINQERRDTMIDVGGQFQLTLKYVSATDPVNEAISVNLGRPGRTFEKIAEIPGRQGRISRSEYRHLFPNPKPKIPRAFLFSSAAR